MTRSPSKFAKPLPGSKLPSSGRPREATVDDIIKDLLDLFQHLGLDAGRLADRVVKLDAKAIGARRLYPHASAIGELLSAWHQDPNYVDEFGNPLPLKMRAGRSSFRQLAQNTVPNIDPKSLLLELKRIGAISVDADRLIRARTRTVPVYENRKLAVQHTLTSLDGFIRTLRHNLNSAPSNSEQLFHRVAWNGEFNAQEIPALKIMVKRYGQNFLESCDSWMTRRERIPASKGRKHRKPVQVFVGVYLAVDSS